MTAPTFRPSGEPIDIVFEGTTERRRLTQMYEDIIGKMALCALVGMVVCFVLGYAAGVHGL